MAVPRRVLRHRARHAARHRRGHPPAARAPGALLGNPVLLWIGIRSLRAVPVPLADLPDHPAGGRATAVGRPVRRPPSCIAGGRSPRSRSASSRRRSARGQVGRWWRRLQSSRDPAPRRADRRRRRGRRRAVGVRGDEPGDRRAQAERDRRSRSTRPRRVDAGPRRPARDADHRRPEPSTERRRRPPTDGGSVAPGATGRAGVDDDRRRRRRPRPRPTLPPPPPPIVAIGDSVMLGAADELTGQGIVVDAEVSRQMQTMIPEVEQLRDAGQLRRHGRRPPRHERHPRATRRSTEFFTALSGVPKVVVLTVSAPARAGSTGNNAKIVALPAQFPNVRSCTGTASPPSAPATASTTTASTSARPGQDYYTAADRQPARTDLTSAARTVRRRRTLRTTLGRMTSCIPRPCRRHRRRRPDRLQPAVPHRLRVDARPRHAGGPAAARDHAGARCAGGRADGARRLRLPAAHRDRLHRRRRHGVR